MNLESFKSKLSSYKKEDIIITQHAKLQALARNITINEVKNNLLNPINLVYIKEQQSKKIDEQKYDCYFAFSKTLYHRYILVLNRKVIIVTIIKINRDWQKAIG